MTPFLFTMQDETFKKEEKLRSEKLIGRLFSEGKAMGSFPLRMIWLPVEHSVFPAQVLFSVPKRKFKKATDRNRIKRQMREIYRKNKSALYYVLVNHEQRIALGIIYTGNDLPQFDLLSDKIILTLQRLAEEVTRHTTKNSIQ